jgi:hypothetical protein
MRRRKAERAKKFLEVEVQRLKTQVQVGRPFHHLSKKKFFVRIFSNLTVDHGSSRRRSGVQRLRHGHQQGYRQGDQGAQEHATGAE